MGEHRTAELFYIFFDPMFVHHHDSVCCGDYCGGLGSKARFQVKKVLVFGAMEDIMNDEYLARS